MQSLLSNARALLIILFLFGFFSAQGQDVNAAALKNFIHDSMDNKLSNSELGNKYFCTNILHLNDKNGEKARSGLEFALSNQRRILRTQQINADDIVIKPFNQLSEKEMPPKPFHMLHETSNVYVCVFQGKPVLFFLMNSDKIASTLLISQGDEHYFIDFCH